MRRQCNGDLHLHQHLCTVDHYLQCNLHGNSTGNSSINLCYESYRSSLPDTVSHQCGLCNLVSYSKRQRWM